MTDQGGCQGHPGVGGELRALVLTLLDQLEPVVDRVRTGPTTPTAACASCPVCAVLAVVRGERPELAVRLAEQAGGLLAVLRAALEEGGPAAARPQAPPRAERAPTGRPVQRIPVVRVAR